MRKLIRIFALITILTVIFGNAFYAEAGPFKKGQALTIIIPFSPGGGYDRIARLLQPTLNKYINEINQAEVNLIVNNITGAGGVRGYSAMYRATMEGTTIGMVGLAASPYQQIIFEEFDLNKFTYLAQVNKDLHSFAVAKDSPVNNVNDLIKRAQQKSFLMGTSGRGASEHLDSIVTKHFIEKSGIKMPLDYVHYDGTSVAMLGVVKGEAEGMITSETTFLPMVKQNRLKVIGMFSKERSKHFPDVPTLIEQKIPDGDKLANIIGMIRILVGPPGMKEDAAKVWRDSLQKAVNDPEFLQKAKTAELSVDYGTGDAARAIALSRLEVAKELESIVKPLFKK